MVVTSIARPCMFRRLTIRKVAVGVELFADGMSIGTRLAIGMATSVAGKHRHIQCQGKAP